MKDRNGYDPTAAPKDMPAVVAAFRQSGVSLKEFAREHRISPGRLHYWVYEKNQSAKPRALAKKARTVAAGGAVFQEVKLEPGRGLLQSWAAEVNVPRGVNVRFSGAASPDWIAAVVQALQRPC